MLYKLETQFSEAAKKKKSKLINPNNEIEEGFLEERMEKGFHWLYWWDKYHQRFGPNLTSMTWREPQK